MIASGPTARHAVISIGQNINRDVKSTGRGLFMAGLFLFSLFLTSLSMAGLTAPAFAAEPITPLTGRITIEYQKDKTAETPAATGCPDGTVRMGANCIKDRTSAAPAPSPKTPPRVTAKAPEGEEPDESELYPRVVQEQLERVGCLDGAVDGDWGPGSRRSLRAFYQKADRSTANLEPTRAAIRLIQSKPRDFCNPAVTKDKGPKQCRRGFEDNGRGVCIRTVRPEDDAPRMPPDHGDGEEQRKNLRCGPGTVKRGGRCVTVNCPTNAHQTRGTKCACNAGFVERGQSCVKPAPQKCPANAFRNGASCKCNPGFDAVGNQCVRRAQKVNCPANAHHTTGRNCACNAGFSPQGQQCVPVRQQQAPPAAGPANCGPPMRWYQGRCVPG